MDKVTPEERDELDKAARWRRCESGWIICDPTLDDAIALAREARKKHGTLNYRDMNFPPGSDQ